MSYKLTISGLAAFRELDEISDKIELQAQQAINKTADRFRTQAERRMMGQINYPPGYLKPSNKRLYVSRYARKGQLEASIYAAWRPTSLARFATTTDPAKSRKAGVSVAIKRGSPQPVKGAFLVRLRSGTALTETKFNLGLAIRLRPGEALRSPTKRKLIQFTKGKEGLYLLYGPSVAQAFAGRDVGSGGPGIRDEITPAALAFLEAEFLRLRGRR